MILLKFGSSPAFCRGVIYLFSCFYLIHAVLVAHLIGIFYADLAYVLLAFIDMVRNLLVGQKPVLVIAALEAAETEEAN